MSKAIDKGARFRVMTGDLRGRGGVVTEYNQGELLDWYRLDLGADTFMDVTLDELNGPDFQRLADAPPVADPMLAEIVAKILDLDILDGEGPENAIDMIASIAGNVNADSAGSDEAWRATYRAALLECAAYAFAGLRDTAVAS